MIRAKFLMGLTLAVSILLVQIGGVFAAPAYADSTLITGKVDRITLDTNANTGITTVIIELTGQSQTKQIVRISQETAVTLGLVTLDVDGPVINTSALGTSIEVDPATVIPAGGADRHPVGNALATYFSDIAGLDYDTIMDAHDRGMGFGVIAQALWLTSEIPGGQLTDFQALILARTTGDYTSFMLEDGTTPKNWGELRKAILDGKNVANLGSVMSNRNHDGDEDYQIRNKENKNKDNDKEKETEKNGNGNGNGK